MSIADSRITKFLDKMDVDVKSLIQQVEEAFNQSDIKEYAERHGKKWFFYLSSTRLTKREHTIPMVISIFH